MNGSRKALDGSQAIQGFRKHRRAEGIANAQWERKFHRFSYDIRALAAKYKE